MSYQVNFHPIGRSGNILFQCAATLGYARKHGYEWGMPSDTREVPHFRKMFPNIPVIDGNFKRINWTDAAFFNYQPIPDFKRDVTLVGFWQSEKYFEGQHDEIKRLFKLDIQPQYSEYVSVHVRRGDYATNPRHFPPVNEFYLELAGQVMQKQSGFDKVIVFSDDIQWCKENTRSAFDWIDVEFCEEKDEFKSLSLMASCRHNIIANSSFSWWGAWLNPNPDKIVVCPSYKNWFGPENSVKNPKDLPCSNWIQIEY